jgi:hypothetical protein
MKKIDYTSAVCIRLYLPALGVEERCRLGYPNDNRCVAGHPYCHQYRHIPEMMVRDGDENGSK